MPLINTQKISPSQSRTLDQPSPPLQTLLKRSVDPAWVEMVTPETMLMLAHSRAYVDQLRTRVDEAGSSVECLTAIDDGSEDHDLEGMGAGNRGWLCVLAVCASARTRARARVCVRCARMQIIRRLSCTAGTSEVIPSERRLCCCLRDDCLRRRRFHGSMTYSTRFAAAARTPGAESVSPTLERPDNLLLCLGAIKTANSAQRRVGT